MLTYNSRAIIDQAKFTSGVSTKKAAVFLQDMKHEAGSVSSQQHSSICQWTSLRKKTRHDRDQGHNTGQVNWPRGTQIHKWHHFLCIYFQACFQSAVCSSVPSGGALGSRKSGCWSSFRYLGGVRMWVEPTRDKRLKGQQGLNSWWRPVYYWGCTLDWWWQNNPLMSN